MNTLKVLLIGQKPKRDEELISLNFDQRMKQKILDNNFTSKLDKQYDELSKISYPQKEVELDIVLSQNLKSRQIRGDEKNENPNSFSKSPNLDIRLHESCRIMADWISLLDKKLSLAEPKELKEI